MATGTAVTTARVDNGTPVPATLHVEREQIDITTRYEPDPNWEYVDPAGHWHARASNGDDPAASYPTLRANVEHRDCNGACGGGDCDGYDTTVWRCRACGADVEPGTRETVGRRYTDGHESWEVTVEQQVTGDEQVSVVVDLNDGGVAFGMAAVLDTAMESTGEGVRVWTRLGGMSPLGRR